MQTKNSMKAYFAVFFGGFAIFASMIGWGYLIDWLLLRRQSNWGLRAALGLALSVNIGGWLNLFGRVSKFSIAVFLAAGMVFLGYFVFMEIRQKFSFSFWKNRLAWLKNFGKLNLLLALIVVLSVLVRYGTSVAFFDFHPTDDYQAYMAFPVKMLQTGSLGNDPFSDRRISSSLGGKYFLDSFALTFGQEKNLHLMDSGVGFVIFILLVGELLAIKKINRTAGLFVLLLASVTVSPSGNITSFFTASALLLGLIILNNLPAEPESGRFQRLLAMALMVAAVCALKSSLIPVGVSLVAVFLLVKYFQTRKMARLAKDAIVIACATFFMIMPWSIALLQSSGTLLYPLLGKGYYGTAYGVIRHYLEFNLYSFFRLVSEFLKAAPLFLPLLAMGIWASLKKNVLPSRNILLGLFYAASVGILALVYSLGGYSLLYYSFPFVWPIVIVFIVDFLSAGQENGLTKPSGFFFGVLVIAFLLGVALDQNVEVLQQAKDQIKFDKGVSVGLINSSLIVSSDLAGYRDLQNSVPPGQTIMARLDKNFIFNFKRNPIYINDLPGGASPPPGLPLFQGSEHLANYLLSKSVRYVAYSYKNEANFSRATAGSMLRPHVNPLFRMETVNIFDFQDNLMSLASSRKKIYDDGKNFVPDLAIKQ